MEKKAASGASGAGIDRDCQTPVLLDSGKSRWSSLAFKPLPLSLLGLVGDYLSNNRNDPVKCALIGKQPITFCLSQTVRSKLASFWYMGFFPPERPWREQTDVKVDKEIPINDHEGCLQLLSQKSSKYCQVVIDIFVVNLRLIADDAVSVLDALQNTIRMLQDHLTSIRHVVISISEYASCHFSLQTPIDKVTGLPRPFHQQRALSEIVKDLQTCWNENHMLTARDLFQFFFNGVVPRASEKHLAHFIIALTHPLSRNLFKEEAPKMVSNKIVWVYHRLSVDDLCFVDQDTARFCHLVDCDTNRLSLDDLQQNGISLQHLFCYEDNPMIQRIAMTSGLHGSYLQLPRPSMLITAFPPLSALVEISLKGPYHVLLLTDLNNGFFPRLEHLTVIGGRIKGHLDSQHVPSLKTLILENKRKNQKVFSPVDALVQNSCHSLIQCGRPWQVVATQEEGGWSLASYDECITNPQDEEKEASLDVPSHSQPLIRELMLVASSGEVADEWLLQLNGHPSPEATAADHNDRILMWKSDRVLKITAFSRVEDAVCLNFQHLQQAIPGQASILASLTCHSVDLVADGDTLSNLQSLYVKNARVKLSGAFPLLETLSFDEACLASPWKMDAPELQSFSCRKLFLGKNLSCQPQLLPRLSYLEIEPRKNDVSSFPEIINHDMGLSQIKHVVFDKIMTYHPAFEACRVHCVSHLELDVMRSHLPKTWASSVWQCETLKLTVCAMRGERYSEAGHPNGLLLPLLPKVKKMTLIEDNCDVLLDSVMPNLMECTVPSPKSFGANLRCPVLDCIRFSRRLSPRDKVKCLDRATYLAMGARPRWVCFKYGDEVHSMTWDVAPNKTNVLPLIETL